MAIAGKRSMGAGPATLLGVMLFVMISVILFSHQSDQEARNSLREFQLNAMPSSSSKKSFYFKNNIISSSSNNKSFSIKNTVASARLSTQDLSDPTTRNLKLTLNDNKGSNDDVHSEVDEMSTNEEEVGETVSNDGHGDEHLQQEDEYHGENLGDFNTSSNHPRPDRYLMMVCGFGKMSNRMHCIQNHIMAAIYLKRTLVFPFHEAGYPFGEVLDIPRISKCLGNSSVISLEQFRHLSGEQYRIDLMRILPTRNFHKYRENGLRRFLNLTEIGVNRTEEFAGKLKGESTMQFFRRFDDDVRVISMGDGFDVQIGSEALRMQMGIEVGLTKCKGTVLQPHANILQAALGFIRTFLGSSYVSVHLRRSDFLNYCGKFGCFYPIPQIAWCLLRKQQPVTKQMMGGIVYLATDASPEEIDELRTLINRAGPQAPTLITLAGTREAMNLETSLRMPRRIWNAALTDTQMELAESRAMLDRVICAVGATFISSSHSTFSMEVRRLRTAWGLTKEHDSSICHGIVSDWKQPPW